MAKATIAPVTPPRRDPALLVPPTAPPLSFAPQPLTQEAVDRTVPRPAGRGLTGAPSNVYGCNVGRSETAAASTSTSRSACLMSECLENIRLRWLPAAFAVALRRALAGLLLVAAAGAACPAEAMTFRLTPF